MITSQTYLKQTAGNGVSVNFNTPIFFDNSHLVVYITDANGVSTVKTITTHYTLTGINSPLGGICKFVNPPAAGETVSILRIVPLTQETDYINNDAFDADAHERQMDLIVQGLQQVSQSTDGGKRTLVFPITEPASHNLELDDYVSRASTFIYFDEDGLPVKFTAAQVASVVLPELNLGASTPDRPTVTTANNATRAALAPSFTGQILVQLDTGGIYEGTGLSAGNWQLVSHPFNVVTSDVDLSALAPVSFGQRVHQSTTGQVYEAVGLSAGKWKRRIVAAASLSVADASARAAQIPDFVGQYLYVADDGGGTPAWYIGIKIDPGEYVKISAWASTSNYSLDDIIEANGLLWVCIETHTNAPTWSDPGAGQGWQRYWKPWLIEGFHYWQQQASDYAGTETRSVVVVGESTILPDWTFALNWILGQTDLMQEPGGASDDAKWIDGYPLVLASSADSTRAWADSTSYNAGDWAHHNNVWYKCVVSHTSDDGATPGVDDGAGDNEPGIGTDWEANWISWSEDHRSLGHLLFTAGYYYLSKPLKAQPGLTLQAPWGQSRNRVYLVAKTGYTEDYLVEYAIRGKAGASYSCTSNFQSSVLDVNIDGRDLCHGILFCGSHGSILRAEFTNFAYHIPIVTGPSCDDIVIEPLLKDTNEPSRRSPFGLYIGHNAQNVIIKNAIIGQAGVGISFGTLQGCAIYNSEMEAVALPVEVRRNEHDDFYPGTWATSTTYEIGDGIMHGGIRYRCYNRIASSAATDEPGVGATWAESWWDEEANLPGMRHATKEGINGGLTIIGGQWSRIQSVPNTDTVPCCLFDRVNPGGGRSGTIMLGVFLTNNSFGTGDTWQYVTIQEVAGGSPNDTYDFPIYRHLTHTFNELTVSCDTRGLEWYNRNMVRGAVYPASGGAGNTAQMVDSRWVSANNPTQFTVDGNQTITLYRGLYEVGYGGSFGGGTLTIDDVNGTPIQGFSAVLAAPTTNNMMWHNGGDINIALVGATSPSLTVYFMPRKIGMI